MVMTLNGSTTLRSASHAFSGGVSGFTWGPLVKRVYQFTMGGGQGGVLGRGVVLSGGLTPAAAAALAPAIDPAAMPAFLTWQGPVEPAVARGFAFGWGASVGCGWGTGLSGCASQDKTKGTRSRAAKSAILVNPGLEEKPKALRRPMRSLPFRVLARVCNDRAPRCSLVFPETCRFHTGWTQALLAEPQ